MHMGVRRTCNPFSLSIMNTTIVVPNNCSKNRSVSFYNVTPVVGRLFFDHHPWSIFLNNNFVSYGEFGDMYRQSPIFSLVTKKLF